ncbi:MAG: GreA/GreB family elongation factor [Chloroflexi bacterium]|nr:GreA/GreB family elongation factor [Chloroflexota bacterium]
MAFAQAELDSIDARIVELEGLLATAQVIGDGPPPARVQPGSHVTVRYEDGAEEGLTLVGALEADAANGRVSIVSPAGKALLGKGLGADVSLGTSADRVTLRIVRLGKPDPAEPGQAAEPGVRGGQP